MKATTTIISILLFLCTFSTYVISQEKETKPFIVSIVPDSVFTHYEYSQTTFIVVEVDPQFLGDPVEAAIVSLNEKIVATCKLNKFDGFILNQMVPVVFNTSARFIAYGTLIRTKGKASTK